MKNREFPAGPHTGQYKDASNTLHPAPHLGGPYEKDRLDEDCSNEIEGEPNFHRGNTLHPAPHLGGPYEKDRLDEDRSNEIEDEPDRACAESWIDCKKRRKL